MDTPVNTVPGRYLVFAGLNFFPRGGAKDLPGNAYPEERSAISSAKFYITSKQFEWAQVYDTITQAVIFETKQY